jgi:hypothetical protein
MTRAARGASAYTRADDGAPWAVSEISLPPVAGANDAASAAWRRLIDELLRIRNLRDGWDGEGTPAPHPSLVDGAIRWAQDFKAIGVSPADRVIAGVNGTVYFEWHAPLYQEIEVTSPIDAEWRRVRKGSDLAEVGRLSRRL